MGLLLDDIARLLGDVAFLNQLEPSSQADSM